ncbi:MAG: ligase-associated DNA damage response endonuclease PdeM [Leptolyngbyaceae cyanobacterium RM2_2_4]|nr:ligase-associated DNA damage response endonuclease PdeM [Leptolyngbyaceae cyanobacterium SM1_4_3]NJN90049.1 ligase-associated DNA damage response endonuclease PdeM [Leptolyngbyaceae cyanobacterium SL_5_14]NJO51591.1 ligase-associated DNA damage response endonuclease PdeM [Leptolyngbyaceae cyanobacterium RM2_2_4]NJO66249.1 ligase-associated DNA damage response endonuclease PdeM [Leptolyngbyaceae cyanobacterium RM1_405_57]
MKEIDVLGMRLQLLAEKAVYLEDKQTLLVADIHLGKSETFQSLGIPIPNRVNQTTLDRLEQLCLKVKPQKLFVLGDLFHSKYALVDEVLEGWSQFQAAVDAEVVLIVGNHDRPLIQVLKNTSIQCSTHAIEADNLLLSHEPSPQQGFLNICGHIHPCVHLKEKLDQLRLPCFYLDRTQNLLVLPSFGEFTGAYEVSLERNSAAYVIADDCVVALER